MQLRALVGGRRERSMTPRRVAVDRPFVDLELRHREPGPTTHHR